MSTRTQTSATFSPNAVSYLVGIDGGGTGTRARLASRDGKVLGFGAAGPSGLAQGIEQAWTHIAQAIVAAFADAGLEPAPLDACALGLGLAGAHLGSRAKAFLDAAPAYGLVAVDTDAYTGLLGAHDGRPGALLAAGTGSIGEAWHFDGRHLFVSGFGFGVGDEGSGAWLGVEAMRVAQHAQDGRQPAGALARAVWALTGPGREDLLAWCANAGQHEFAQLAPLVFEAEASDPVAAQLLARAVHELEAVVHAMDPEGALPLAISGSIGLRLASRFSGIIQARCVQPVGDSADGALRLIEQALSRTL
ncbi:MAG: ATPase [Burkholderiaceae bacterium]|nr:ATPase [Burkholderiaceae bacterium]